MFCLSYPSRVSVYTAAALSASLQMKAESHPFLISVPALYLSGAVW